MKCCHGSETRCAKRNKERDLMSPEEPDQKAHGGGHEKLGKEHLHAEQRDCFSCDVTALWPRP